MKLLEQFKDIFPDASYNEENDTIEVFYENGNHLCTLFYAHELINECYENKTVESGELDPQERTPIQVTAEQYIEMEFGSYLDAFKSI